jgi:hypothetical protein
MTGQGDYEQDVKRRPRYPDGSARKRWHELDDVARWSWQRAPVCNASATEADDYELIADSNSPPTTGKRPRRVEDIDD